ncbi:hypothetical protein J6590_072038 [Homalodisca vitripennis]|nr:hypothetical protein J6590_072038 [Homalodisca vitripennis]
MSIFIVDRKYCEENVELLCIGSTSGQIANPDEKRVPLRPTHHIREPGHRQRPPPRPNDDCCSSTPAPPAKAQPTDKARQPPEDVINCKITDSGLFVKVSEEVKVGLSVSRDYDAFGRVFANTKYPAMHSLFIRAYRTSSRVS